jgi:hypothetical protein
MKTILPHFENNIHTIQKTHKLHPFYVDEMEEYIDNMDHLTNLDCAINAALRPHGQQGTKGFADGERFDSYWEYAFYLYQKECNAAVVIRNHTDNFPYTDENGKLRKFYPDFIVNGNYYEVKGWLRPSDHCKMDQNPNVNFVFGDDIKPMVQWLNQHHPKWRDEYQELS